MPWLFFGQVVSAYKLGGFLALVIVTLIFVQLSRRLSQRLESRADRIARSNEGDDGTYARALARLYEENLLPAVNPSKRQTHPHLYDRLLAAGVEPDYPRPAAPETMATHGGILAGLLGILAVLNFMRLFH